MRWRILGPRADLITRAANGRGVIELLHGDLLKGTRRIHPARWRIPLGTYHDGTAATIPASQVNVLVTGGTQAGKSYLAGLIAEGLIQLSYSVVIIDAEGDHTNLAELHDVVHLGGHEPVPSASTLRSLLSHHGGSIIADLSQLTSLERNAWYQQAPPRLTDLRRDRGLPHWVIVDEAHESLGQASASRHVFTPSRKGHCLVTYHPTELCEEARDNIDILIAAPPTNLEDDPVVAAVASFTGLANADILRAFASLTPGSALLVDSSEPGTVRPFRLGSRLTAHVRHGHKYATADLPSPHRFFFQRSTAHPAGQIAANLRDFHHELARCEPDVITHHATARDFSRWISGVFRDDRLAAEIERIETDLLVDWDDRIETARHRLLSAIEQRFPA